MMYWLIPRLARFHEAHPDVELRYNMSHGAVDLMRDNVGVAIRLSPIDSPEDVIRSSVVTDWIGPVFPADYLRVSRLSFATDLINAHLIVSKTRPQAWLDWRRFCGQDTGELPIDETFDHFYLLIQAAKCGLGMANVTRMLVKATSAVACL